MLKTTDIMLLTCIVLSGMLFFFVGKSCNEKPDSHKGDKSTLDSMIAVVKHQVDSTDRKVDSANQVNAELTGKVQQLAEEKTRLQQAAKASAGKAEWYAFQYDQAKKYQDTAKALASCDSLASEFEVYKSATEQTITEADSIITAKDMIIENRTMVINAQTFQIQSLEQLNKVQSDKYATLYTDYKKERRKDNWFSKWGKPVLAAVAGGFIVHQIMK